MVALIGSDRAMREAATLRATGTDREAGSNMIIAGTVNTIEIATAFTTTVTELALKPTAKRKPHARSARVGLFVCNPSSPKQDSQWPVVVKDGPYVAYPT